MSLNDARPFAALLGLVPPFLLVAEPTEKTWLASSSKIHRARNSAPGRDAPRGQPCLEKERKNLTEI